MQALFDSPLIGPFVERNGLADKSHLGVTITWTSAGEAYRLNLIRDPRHSLWSDSLGFAQAPQLDFEEFLWHCFEHNSGLLAFLRELRPFIRASIGSPTPADAGKWLNPVLVASGFSLGIAKVRKNGVIRVPVVWVFDGDAAKYGSKTRYARLDFIDWTSEGGATLLYRYDHWGTGARALARLLHQSVAAMREPLLTAEGEARMRQILDSNIAKVKTPRKDARLTETDKPIASILRKSLRTLSDHIPPEVASKVERLSEHAYARLVRTCIRQNLEHAACCLLTHRPLPGVSRRNLLEGFIDQQWLRVWTACGREAHPELTASGFGYNALLYRVIQQGNVRLLRAVLACLSSITGEVAGFMLEQAFGAGQEDLVEVILTAHVVQPVREKCLLLCFTHSLHPYNQRQTVAIRLLELGLRPIRAMKKDDILGPAHLLLQDENHAILRRALELDPPTEESMGLLLDDHFLRSGESFRLVLSVSRALPNHKTRMLRVAFKASVSFIRGGSKEAIDVLNLTFDEGIRLAEIPWADFEGAKLLSGYDWRRREGNWIDLIGYLLRTGRNLDADYLKRLNRRSK